LTWDRPGPGNKPGNSFPVFGVQAASYAAGGEQLCLTARV
jgi:hypothetical protein